MLPLVSILTNLLITALPDKWTVAISINKQILQHMIVSITGQILQLLL